MPILGWGLNLGFAGGEAVVVTPALAFSITLDAETAHSLTVDTEQAHAVTYGVEAAQSITLDVNQNA